MLHDEQLRFEAGRSVINLVLDAESATQTNQSLLSQTEHFVSTAALALDPGSGAEVMRGRVLSPNEPIQPRSYLQSVLQDSIRRTAVIAATGRYCRFGLGHGDHGGSPHLSGLIDPQALNYDGARSGVNDARSAPGRGAVGGLPGGGREDNLAATPLAARLAEESALPHAKAHISNGNGRIIPYTYPATAAN